MDDSELLVDFVEEAREHLGDIEIQLLQIEAMGADIDANLVNTVFRGIHSVKGAAGFLGLSQINAVSHRLEDVLNRIRDRKLTPDPFNVDVMLKAADRLKNMIESVETSNQTDNTAICQKLDDILTANTAGSTVASPQCEPEWEPAVAEVAVASATKSAPAKKAKSNAARSKPNASGAAKPAASGAAKPAASGAAKPAASGAAKPSRRKANRSEVAARAAAELESASASKSKPSRRSGSAAQPKTPAPKGRTAPGNNQTAASDSSANDASANAVGDRVSEALDSITESISQVDAPVQTVAASSAPIASPKPAAAGSSSDAPEPKLVSDPTIRVGVRVLDRLMNLAGELVLGRNQLMQAVTAQTAFRTAAERASKKTDSSGIHAKEIADNHSKLDTIAANLDQVTTELQEAIMQTRMQPIGNVFNKFPRVIRDLSASLGKQITLRTEGNEVETDKTIVEAIADPLTHLVRNSCDHGVETPDVRLAAGKPANGTVVLKAYHQAGKVMIEIVDDGAGIDPARLKSKALEKGIIDAETAAKMSDREAVNLIFAPGFSTAAAITAVSGRGVGMDVVRTNIEKIGGSVEVRSTLGKGSTVHITLPLTLAIVPSMIVSVGGRPYALPQSGIVELVQTDGKEKCIQTASSAEVLRLRGQLLPLIRMNDVLSCGTKPVSASSTDTGSDTGSDTAAPDADDCQLVVFESGRHRFALAVDRVLDSEEIVVKPLGRHLSNLPLLAGSTILGDGRVALILDAAGIAARISLRKDSEPDTPDLGVLQTNAVDLQRLVLLSTSERDRFAVSMDIVSRIERVPVSDIETIGKEKLLQYRNKTLPLLSINDVATVSSVDDHDHVYVVVFRVYGHEVGLIAPNLHDIRDCDLSAGVQSSAEPGVAGIAVIGKISTRLLDLYGMTEIARPEWFEKSEDVADNAPARVLVCEDSAFFRTFLVKTLKEEGHEVVAANDGELGWTELDTRGNYYDLLLTDVEMPNLNGFELTRRARNDARFKRMPIIALTSLADEESNRLGREAGVSDYQVKMNKPDLLASIERLVAHARSQKTTPPIHESAAPESAIHESAAKEALV